MAISRPALFASAVGLAVTLAGCSSSGAIDKLPEAVGGLPPGAPERPVASYQYPAVHDMPPPRATQPMSAEDQVKTQTDLERLRDRQEREAGVDPDKKTAAPAKPKPPKRQADKQDTRPPKQPAAQPPSDVIVVPPAGASVKP
jgi:hypothetical protein